MSDARWRITYVGDGVVSNQAGTFARDVTAYVDESLARSLANDPVWEVRDPSGSVFPWSALAQAPGANEAVVLALRQAEGTPDVVDDVAYFKRRIEQAKTDHKKTKEHR